MKAAIRFVRKWWWLFLLGLAAIGSVLWKLLSRKPADTVRPVTETFNPTPTLVEKARDKVEKVHLEGEVEKAKTRTVADEHVEQIKAIEEKGKKDPKQARKELADFLATNL